VSALAVEVLDVSAEPYAAAPFLRLRLRVSESTGAAVSTIALRCQVRIEPQRRGYDAEERAGLLDLFGGPERWAETLRPFLWTHATAMVRGFSGSTDVDLLVPCTYDFEVVAAKYLAALGDGDVPLVLLFNGTVFSRSSTGVAVEPVAWDVETPCRMPVRVWRELMDFYFPGTAWIRLDRSTHEALARFRSAHGLTSWEAALERLLAGSAPPDVRVGTAASRGPS
jgi:hypothetical protein